MRHRDLRRRRRHGPFRAAPLAGPLLAIPLWFLPLLAAPMGAQAVAPAATATAPPTPVTDALRALRQSPAGRRDSALVNAVARFHAGLGDATAWLDERGLTAAGVQLREVIRAAADDGLDPRRYPLPVFDAGAPGDRRRADVQLSYAALRFALDLGRGQVAPSAVARDHAFIRRTWAGDSLLRAWRRAPDAGVALRAVTPTTPEYAALRTMLRRLREIAEQGAWQPLSAGATLRRGALDARVAELRARLVERGDLPAAHGTGDLFDETVAAAVARFQERHGLVTDSVFGPASRTALNVPVAARLAQVRLGMERLRWLPPVAQGPSITVNLGAQQVVVHDAGRITYTTRVIIGDLENRTPMFVDTLTNIVFNPAWNVPPSIANAEILPKLRRDPGYLARNHMVRIGRDIQQLPGPWNALGQIAFMFPNRFNVYLHDTPAKELFTRTERAFSHGCIRVERPHDLALTLLEPDGWTPARIDSVIATGTRTVVWLRSPVPVRITYLTAFTGDEDTLHFRPDLYGRDALLQAVLDRE